jgi:DNA-binding transcriptional LysR family regulator
MDSFLGVKTFVIAARYQGFSEAARQLGIAPSVIAKRIAQLEKALGTRLFERTTRSVQLTEAGEKLYARAGELVAGFEDLLQSVERDESRLVGHIHVVAPNTLTLTYLGQVLTDFLAENDKITMAITLQDEAVNPADRGFDIAINGRSASYEGVVDIPLCPTRVVACAAPAYLARKGPPAHPAELADHDCLVFRATGMSWQFHSPRGAVHIDVAPRLFADDNLTLLRAAVAGMGISVMPLYVARNALATGALVKVLDDYPLQENWFRAFVPRRRLGVARITALVEYIKNRMQTAQWPDEIVMEDWLPQAASKRQPGGEPAAQG